MKLKDFLDSRKIDAIEFAKMVYAHPNTIRLLCKEIHEPRVSLAFKIEEVTKGKVTAKELSQIWERKKNERGRHRTST